MLESVRSRGAVYPLVRRPWGAVVLVSVIFIGAALMSAVPAQATPRGKQPPRPVQTQRFGTAAVMQSIVAPSAADVVGRPGSQCRPGHNKLTYHGGDLVADPQIFLIFWGNEWNTDAQHISAEAAIINMYQQLPTSGYGCAWHEYGVTGMAYSGGGFAGSEVVSSEPPSPVSDNTIQQRIETEVGAGRAPVRTDSMVYVMLTPRGVPVTAPDGSTGCGGSNFVFCAYHDAFTPMNDPTARFRYEVLPFPCSTQIGTCFVDPTDDPTLALEVSGSHELTELVTDPDSPPVGNGGWFSDSSGSENADICASEPCDDTVTVGADTFTVNPAWSNLANDCITSVPCNPPAPIACTENTPGECVQSTGSADPCGFEWLVYPDLRVQASNGLPGRTVSCMDGGPFCDFDGAVDGQCTFHVAACLNSSDPRLACPTASINGIHLTRPSATSTNAMDSANAAAILAALQNVDGASTGTTAGNQISYTPPAATADACTTMLNVVVPLRRNGASRGSKQIILSAQTSAGTIHNRLTLTCLPAAP